MKAVIFVLVCLLFGRMAMAQSSAWPVPDCKASLWRGPVADADTLARLESALDDATLNPLDAKRVAKMNALAIALFSTGKLARGQALFQSALVLWEKSGASEESGMVASIAYMAEIAHCRKEFSQAEALYLRAIKASEMFFGPRDRRMLPVLKNLAGFYYQQRRFADGEVLFERAEAIRLRLNPSAAEPEVLWAAPDLVRHYRNGDLKAAQAAAQKRVEQEEAELQAQQQFVDYRMAEFQGLNSQSAQPAQPAQANPADGLPGPPPNKEALRTALRSATAKLRQRQRALALALNAQAELLHGLQQLTQAETLYLRAFAILKQTASDQTLAAARVLSDLGMLYRARAENGKAESYQQRALDIFLPKLGSEHPDVLDCEAELAFLRKSPTVSAMPVARP